MLFLQQIPGFDNETPPRPDDAGGGDRKVLREGKLFSGASEIADTGQDDRPLFIEVSILAVIGIFKSRMRTFITGALEHVSY